MHDPATTTAHAGRRALLGWLAAAGATTIAGHTVWQYAPWLDYDRHADEARRSTVPPSDPRTAPTSLRELVRYATLAASGHNTQPWRFVLGEQHIEIHPDPSRHLPAVDPDDRELWISLGCALETLCIAARAGGHAVDVRYPDAIEAITVRLAADRPQPGVLFDAIRVRQNTRSLYTGRPVPSSDISRLHEVPLEPGVGLHVIVSESGRATIRDAVRQGNLVQYADATFRSELISWVRFTRREAMATADGLYAPCTGRPAVPRWLGLLVVGRMSPASQADDDDAKLRSSAGVVVVTSTSDTRGAWVRTGQVYTRLALTMTARGIKSALLNQPIEVPAVRGDLASSLALGAAHPQLVVRFGHAADMPMSLRRPVEQVIGSA